MTADQVKKKPILSVWGSGLLAVDVVIRSGDQEIFDITVGGTCANVLSGLATFGWLSAAKGRIGSDPAGERVVSELRAVGVKVDDVVLAENVSTPIILERFGLGSGPSPEHRFEWKCPSCEAPFPRFRPTPIDMLIGVKGGSDRPDVFFFDRPTPGNLRLARALKSSGTLVMFEPPRLKDGREYDDAIATSDVVKVAGSVERSKIEERLARCPLAIVTYGVDGLEYRASSFRGEVSGWTSLPAMYVSRSVDSCGSGDWLTVGFLHAFLAVNDIGIDSKDRIATSLKYGQALAALNCLLPGARGLSRVFSRTEIAEMVGFSLAKGLAGIESRVVKQSGHVGKLRDIRVVCNSCRDSRA